MTITSRFINKVQSTFVRNVRKFSSESSKGKSTNFSTLLEAGMKNKAYFGSIVGGAFLGHVIYKQNEQGLYAKDSFKTIHFVSGQIVALSKNHDQSEVRLREDMHQVENRLNKRIEELEKSLAKKSI